MSFLQDLWKWFLDERVYAYVVAALIVKLFVSKIKNIWLKKVVWYIYFILTVSIFTSNLGFPVTFIKIFNIYAFAGFLLYIILDLPPLKQPASLLGKYALLLGTFILFSGIYTGVSAILPQFDPQFEIKKINKPPLMVIEAGPELIAAGKEVFTTYKCFNCHKADHTGSSDRGPDFDKWQIGLQPLEFLKEAIIDPKKEQAKGFEDPKSKKAMPTYFGEDLSEAEMTAVLAFLQTLWNKEEMPVRGKAENLIRWDEDPEMIELGKKVTEGEVYDDLACAVCHGKDGIPLMDDARDLRNPLSKSRNNDKPMKDWTDADWFKSVAYGVPESPMAAWIEEYPPKAIWLAIAYAKQFSKQPKNQNLPPPPPLEPVDELW